MENFPKVSIIIPTRDRCDTLIYALKTCTNQLYTNLEILICDNCSLDSTREYVESLDDNRIKYINSGKRLSMSHNWEHALNHASGDFITYLGDDDGFLPGAIAEMVKILNATQLKALVWNWGSYYWPNCPSNFSRNLLIYPLGEKIEIRNSAKMLNKVLEFEASYSELPFLYKGIISKELLNSIKVKSRGIFFHSSSPDLYSAIVIAANTNEYVYSQKPYSLNGTSAHSNGAGQFQPKKNDAAIKFDGEDNIPVHPKLVKVIPSLSHCTLDAWMRAKEFFPEALERKIDLERFFISVHKEVSNLNIERYNEVRGVMLEVAKNFNLPKKIQEIFKVQEKKISAKKRPIGLIPGVNLYRKLIILDCLEINVHNIYDASCAAYFIKNRNKFFLTISYFSIYSHIKKVIYRFLGKY